ncbi:hypothetical protein CBL_05190 [Carabus blaptoides fortunei]
MRDRKIKALSEEEVSSATPSSSQNILITPRKLNFEPQTPFLDLSVIAEKEEEHSPRSLIKSEVCIQDLAFHSGTSEDGGGSGVAGSGDAYSFNRSIVLK